MAGTSLTGEYEIRNSALLREKAGRLDDPRHPFYVAMLSTDRYEVYLAEVGKKLVEVKGYKANPISGRAAILYCRRHRWIVDKGAKS